MAESKKSPSSRRTRLRERDKLRRRGRLPDLLRRKGGYSAVDRKRSGISAWKVICAGLGVLHSRSPEEIDELVEAGRRWKQEHLTPRSERILSKMASRRLAERKAEAPAVDMDELIDTMMPSSIPTAPAVLQARRNVAARVALIEEAGLLTSAEVADINRSRAANRAALANRWKSGGRIFSVNEGGRELFPGFQFGPDGRPREPVTQAVEALGGAHGWQTALWFTAANGYLGGRRPLDVLDSEPQAVVEAARHEADEVYF